MKKLDVSNLEVVWNAGLSNKPHENVKAKNPEPALPAKCLDRRQTSNFHNNIQAKTQVLPSISCDNVLGNIDFSLQIFFPICKLVLTHHQDCASANFTW